MKKFLCMVLAVLMLVMSVAAVAESPKFDKSKLTGSPLYKYDKFTQKWSIGGAFVKEYSDARVEVQLALFDSYVQNAYGPALQVSFYNKNTGAYDRVIAIRIVVGDRIFCFEKLGNNGAWSYAFGGSVMEELCTELIAGGEVAIQFEHVDKYGTKRLSTVDPVQPYELRELITMAKLLRDSNAWSIDTNKYGSDALYGATME